ncbi:DNA polymerase III subunit gamma/tau [Psychromonas sp. RZ22]|uniref:DNA polymerase III subunit gamma/tau n=1 Tax=Psychromonas algarum TaxID=2555643 RepID=UPI001067B882|nr:DNA polymerase III subunit gamma/tau [Psychromonas sp. RZ22]TEW56182.1 DNA polymerase III subunit gamma/tau [Psychromonas sp. RZ22]
MSYQVLARKWRPQTFKEVIGQPHVLTALENGLTQNRVHHAYLFSGTRGVGKTTIARILAKSLNCEKGVTATPCGQCANCQDIDQGRFVDLLEIDAASRTKVDDTRELLDNVQYKPAQGRYKVYLIDEVHMLSKHSFNALLKTLEEPPEYVKFLLATTDPQKLPITVLSRCLQFHLKAILPEQIESQLASILAHENATFEHAALNVIAKAADGSMRDALSLTDQALAFGAGNIEYTAVLKMLGTIDQSHLHYLLHFVASGNSQKVFEKIQEFVHLGADFSALHQELASLCHQIALTQLQRNANVSKKSAVQLLAERLTPEEVQLFYQIALEGYKDYSYAPNGKVALEMTVMRLLAFKPANYVDIDEAMLQQAQDVETIVAAPSAPVDSVLPNIDNNSVMPEPVATVLMADVSDTQNINTVEAIQVNTSNEVRPSSIQNEAIQEPIQAETEQLQQEKIAPVKPLNVTAEHVEAVEPKATEKIQPSLTSTNSRNMLRSHRLKREELKKTSAATETALTNNFNVQPVAPEQSFSSTSAVVTASKTTTTSNTPSESSVSFTQPAPDHHDMEQELPPISSYQEQSAEDNYPDYDPGYGRADNIVIENSVIGNGIIENCVIESTVNKIESTPSKSLIAVSTESTSTAVKQTIPKQQTEQVSVPVNNDISDLIKTDINHSQVILSESEANQAPEIDIASYVDDKMTDPWFLAIKAMQLVGLEKLLAKSTVMQKTADKLVLTLHDSQQHLLNNQGLCESLKDKLRHYFGQQYSVSIGTGKVVGHTPAELELIVYQEYLDNAKLSITCDPIVQIFVRDYMAKVYENSIVPL